MADLNSVSPVARVVKVTGYSLLINIHEEIPITISKHTEHAKL